MYKKYFLGVILLCFLFSNQAKINAQKHIVIFVHGTIVSMKDILSLGCCWSNKSRYSAWRNITRKRWKRDKNNNKAVYANRPGLIKISQETISPATFERIFVPFKNNYEAFLSNQNEVIYYTFNWSGSLEPLERREGAYDLYKTIKEIKLKDPDVLICIVAHSHGGNVVLEVSDFLSEEDDFIVDYLVLLGTPIGKKSEHWASMKNNNCLFFFKKILNIYSSYDCIQPIDIFFNDYHFCQRTFFHRLVDIRQLNFKKYNHWNLYYTFLGNTPFIVELPSVLNKISYFKEA